MKLKLTIFLLLISSVSFSQKKNVTVTIRYVQQYCGGARPTEEMKMEAEKEKPYANRTIIYVSNKSKVDSAKTDENGVLKLKLKKGSYQLFETWRYYLYTPHNLPIESFDRKCITEEWQKPVCNIVVTKKEAKIKSFTPIVITCPWNSPCLTNTSGVTVPE